MFSYGLCSMSINLQLLISSARICMQQRVFLLRPNGILVSNVRDLYYFDGYGTIIILHVLHILSLMHIFVYLV